MKMIIFAPISGLASNVLVFLNIVLASAPSFAAFRYTSKGGNLTIDYIGQCSTVQPTGFYRLGENAAGELIPITCQGLGGDVAEFRFRDTKGKERCYGRMTHIWGTERNSRRSRVFTSWKIQGAVSGYSCSQIGKTYEIDMDGGRQIQR